jgi:hypothetical protein
MDHLDAVARQPEFIPYVVLPGREYDQQGFFGFPERQGLNTQELINNGTHDLEIKELESFVQSWLFFGLLSEFSTRDTNDLESFKKRNNNGQRFITTEHLLNYLEKWHAYMQKCILTFERFFRRRLMRIDLVLKDAKLIVLRYLSSKTPKWCIDPDIAMSIMVLGETLRWAVNQLQQKVAHHGIGSPGLGWATDDDRGWGTSHLLIERMVKRHWCPRSIYILQGLTKSSVSGLYYASTFPDPTDSRPGRDHRRCSADQCIANSIDIEDYKLRHVKANCPCSLLQPDIGQIVDVLEKGCIPLLSFTRGHFEVVTYQLGFKFVVVSHVWSDGLGNPEGNAMLSCQIERLDDFVRKFADFQGHDVYFWIDSLMVPVGETRKSARVKAIRKMFDVYEAAHWTVVLDADLMENKVGPDYLEPAMRITMSGWMQRLWTLQEGVMSRSIFFLFKNGLKDIEDLELLYPQAASKSSLASAARSFYLNLIRPRATQRHANIALVSSIWKAIQWRQTTRLSDETLAIGRILNVDEHLLSNSRENRMEILLRKIYEIPPGMIFLPGKRLSTPGFKWAPETWMVGRELEYPDPLSLPSKESNFAQGYNIKVSHSVLTPEGLMVRYPGFRVHNFIAKNPLGCSVRFPVDNSLQRWYNVKCKSEDDFTDKTWKILAGDPPQRLAIICCRPPSANAELALLVMIYKEDGQVLQVNRLLRVFIELETQTSLLEEDRRAFKQNPENSCWGSELPSDRLWVVD